MNLNAPMWSIMDKRLVIVKAFNHLAPAVDFHSSCYWVPIRSGRHYLWLLIPNNPSSYITLISIDSSLWYGQLKNLLIYISAIYILFLLATNNYSLYRLLWIKTKIINVYKSNIWIQISEYSFKMVTRFCVPHKLHQASCYFTNNKERCNF